MHLVPINTTPPPAHASSLSRARIFACKAASKGFFVEKNIVGVCFAGGILGVVDYADLLNRPYRSVNDPFTSGGDGGVACGLEGLSHHGGSHVWTCESIIVK